jgi:hypothetical protein
MEVYGQIYVVLVKFMVPYDLSNVTFFKNKRGLETTS